jgi:methanogenesis multiheme c-type cytochrome
MKPKYLFKSIFGVLLFTLVFLPLSIGSAVAAGGVESSYHGQLGYPTGEGMLEKWCALPNFSFDQQNGIAGWVAKPCSNCHIGSEWNVKGDDDRADADCTYCHFSTYPKRVKGELPAYEKPTPEKCLICHYKDTAKRGDLFNAEEDVHAAAGMACQYCHNRREYDGSNHQFLKGSIIDTTEQTMKGTMWCSNCHSDRPHSVRVKQGGELNRHVEKVACETCHTGLRPAAALASRKWNEFNSDGSPVTKKRAAGWLPEHKWYDGTGPGMSGNYLLPILGYTERRDALEAKIYPFNAVNVVWFVKTSTSSFDEVIPVPEVKAADSIDGDGIGDGDNIVSLEEMRYFYPDATLMTADMNFNISHSVVPKKLAFKCRDCHGRNGWVLDWKQLGYAKDPKGKQKGRKAK